MANPDPDPDGIMQRPGALARLPTGAKLMAWLSMALLPLALIAIFAALQTTRNQDQENRAQLRVAAVESARVTAIELAGDMNALRSTLAAIEIDPDNAPSCARAQGVLAQGIQRGVRFAIVDRGGTLRCGNAVDDGGRPRDGQPLSARVLPGDGVLVTVPGRSGDARASAFFPTSFLDSLAKPSGFDRPYASHIDGDGGTLTLRALDLSRLARRDTVRVPTGVDELTLTLTVRAAPITSAVFVAMVLPIVMWIAAAWIAWTVMDRLIVRPLQRLRYGVGSYQPGDVFDPEAVGTMPAQEIRELGETFRGLSLTIRAHESDLADGLVRQTKLTREVHHRVKNNLQVIASLINFHARSATNPDVTAAYASIQRRVDALAVVHRNHYAELEVNRGLGLRSVAGELAANIRATAPPASAQLGIALDVEPFYVNQDTAVAISFLITELVELAMSVNPVAQLRISVRATDDPERALVRIGSPSLIESEILRDLLSTRYGRVTEGLSRQLRSKLHHDPLIGAFEIAVAVTGRD